MTADTGGADRTSVGLRDLFAVVKIAHVKKYWLGRSRAIEVFYSWRFLFLLLLIIP
jgi:hypothetical protein